MIPPNNCWWLSRCPSPQCLYFPSKFKWSPLWILPKFSLIPPFGFSVTTDPAFVLLKIKWSHPKSSPSLLQAINNGRSFSLCKHGYYSWEKICITFVFHLSWLFRRPKRSKDSAHAKFIFWGAGGGGGGEAEGKLRYILGNRKSSSGELLNEIVVTEGNLGTSS